MPKKESQEFLPLPKDIYQVELLEVEAVKRATYDTRNMPVDQQEIETIIQFQFTVLNGSLRVRNVWDNFVPAYLYIGKNGKNKLYKIVEAFAGRELTAAEEARGISSVTLNSFIGKQCRIAVEPKTKGERTYDVITDYYRATERLAPLTAEEKDKAKVKVKKDESKNQTAIEEEAGVDLSDIPF